MHFKLLTSIYKQQDQASPVFIIFIKEFRLLFFKAVRHRFTTFVLYLPTEKKQISI